MAMITLLFRPFPWEAHNLQALIQRIVASTLEKFLNVHMVLEASTAMQNAQQRIPDWPEANQYKLAGIQKEATKFQDKNGPTAIRPIW